MTGMNISTLTVHLQLNDSIKKLQRQILDTQKEMSSGRKADLMAALRDGAAQAVDLRNTLNEATEFKTQSTLVGSRLDTMQSVITGIKDIVDQARTQSLTATSPVGRQYMSEMAKTAIQQINALLNTNVSGRFLFSGTATDTSSLQNMDAVNAATGVSPTQAVAQAIAGAGGITDAASAVAAANAVTTIFDNSNADPNLQFSSTFYNGATSGTVTARLDNDYELDYGVRADDSAIREALQGLYMLTAVPYGSVPEDAFVAWQQEAVNHLLNGTQNLVELSGTLGYKQSAAAQATARHESTIAQLNTQIANLEAADPYETSMRFSELQNQLDATFSITARLSQLRLTNYL
jgi:flagellar hook-associated protein 3 FlgL